MQPHTYPARPVNGGEWPRARALTPFNPQERAAEPKVNGWRTLVCLQTLAMFERRNQPLSIAAEFQTALERLRGMECQDIQFADCEALERRHGFARGTLVLLDLIPSGLSLHLTYRQRRSDLEGCFPIAPLDPRQWCEPVYLLPNDLNPDTAWTILQDLNREAGCKPNSPFYEGLVTKRWDSRYPIQLIHPERECAAWVKHRWPW